jgi:hypothetical protein
MYRLAEAPPRRAGSSRASTCSSCPPCPASRRWRSCEADPFGPNARLGTYTNFVNLLDLAALAVPGPARPDGLPAGITLIGPRGSDAALAALGHGFAARVAAAGQGARRMIEIAVVGAHLTGLPLNHELVGRGGVFPARSARAPATGCSRWPAGRRAGPACCAWRVARAHPSPPRSGRCPTPASAASSRHPGAAVHRHLLLADGTTPKGFLAEPEGLTGAEDITRFGGWRGFLAAPPPPHPALHTRRDADDPPSPPARRRRASARRAACRQCPGRAHVKMGSLRLIHSMTPHFYQRFAPAGLTIEITTFDSPTDGKNAVVTRSVDFGGFGIAAGTLGAAAGEPVVVIGAFSNRGMGVVAKAGSGITNIAGLRGKRVGIWPGSTQEVFILERLRQSGMTVRDITAVRVPFGEMHAMLSRGDIDAYVGAEPGPACRSPRASGRWSNTPTARRWAG